MIKIPRRGSILRVKIQHFWSQYSTLKNDPRVNFQSGSKYFVTPAKQESPDFWTPPPPSGSALGFGPYFFFARFLYQSFSG
jgi:hypothetical protein